CSEAGGCSERAGPGRAARAVPPPAAPPGSAPRAPPGGASRVRGLAVRPAGRSIALTCPGCPPGGGHPGRRPVNEMGAGQVSDAGGPVSDAGAGPAPVPAGPARCPWALGTADYLPYHDEEWGRPVRDDAGMFERLSLEAFQSGLSWLTILRNRENFRAAFGGFDPAVVAAFGARDTERLLADAGIVRNRAKIEAVIGN